MSRLISKPLQHDWRIRLSIVELTQHTEHFRLGIATYIVTRVVLAHSVTLKDYDTFCKTMDFLCLHHFLISDVQPHIVISANLELLGAVSFYMDRAWHSKSRLASMVGPIPIIWTRLITTREKT